MKPKKSATRRLSGTIIRVLPKGDCGFIEPDDENLPHYFANITNFSNRKDLIEGRRVEFDPGDPKIAPPAFNIVGLPDA